MKKRGFALVTVLMLAAVLFLLGMSALTISQLGYELQSSQISRVKAKNAADYGLSEGINFVVANRKCAFQVKDYQQLNDGSSYRFITQPDTSQQNCLVWAEGKYGNAKVIKTAFIPISVSLYGAMDVRNNPNINLSGSSSIANCDTQCPGPGLTYGGSLTGSFTVSTTCQNNNEGIVGSPAVISTDTVDRIPRYFQAQDQQQLFQLISNRFLQNYGSIASDGTINVNTANIPPICMVNTLVACTLDGTTLTCGEGASAITLDVSNCPIVYVPSTVTVVGGASLTLVAGGDVNVVGSISNVNILTNGNLTFAPQTGNQFVMGGFFYAKGNISVNGQGNFLMGTLPQSTNSGCNCSTGNPFWAIALGNLILSGQGTTSVNGFVFNYGQQTEISGNFNVNGSLVNNNPNSFSLQNQQGNASINFNYCVMECLRQSYPDIIAAIKCGGSMAAVESFYLRFTAVQY